ncbi:MULTISPECIES: hypothetical protein [unclassified Mycobacterium]|uniref:hypothetical protein n=1 Tax=unclassified Mycobacterium TaxID=2642494 RepID=UPI0029C7B4C6|nr:MULTISPECIES: hypothetical protein [unclassified Mycobacterium]
MGAQKGTAELTVENDKLSGKLKTPMGTASVDGSIEGDRATWKSSVKVPMAVTFKFDVAVEGDTFSGTVDTGVMGAFPITGARA